MNSHQKKDTQKNGEPELSVSEAKLRAILDTTVEGIITIAKDGIIESMNPSALKMFGYDTDEVVGQNVKKLMPSPYREEHDGYLARYVGTGEKRIIGIGREVVGQRKNGSTFPMYLSVGEVWFEDKWFFTGIVRDITEQKRAESRSAGFVKILDETRNEIHIFDAVSLRYIRVNRGARNNLGYSMDELRRLTPLDLAPQLKPESFSALVQPLRTGEEDHIRFETVHRRKDGSLYPIDECLQLSELEGRPVFVAMILDTTERQRSEERITGFGRIVEESLNEIYIFDAQSLRYLEVNRGARENTGYSMDELRQLMPLDLAPQLSREQLEELLSPLRDSEEDTVDFQTAHRRKDASFYEVDVHLQLSTWDSRPAYVAIILDTTERRAAERAQRLAAVGETVAGIAHESRNALQRIQVGIEMLGEELEGNPNSVRELARIQRASDHLHGLLEQVRDYSAPIRLVRSRCNLAEIWKSAWENLHSVRAEPPAQLHEQVQGVELECLVDSGRFEQVFRNLFENSFAACEEATEIEICCDTDEDMLRIAVSDNGPGIPEEARPQIFDAFFTTKTHGTGLGMPIVRRIVEAHGGTIELGDKTAGAEFVLILPQID